ncbi:MAG: hypothetical protein HUK01_02195 [Bacteroidaceae bacterium]|nr:hypothetical protein [Bacteroidaceae bacterium]
MKKLTIYVLAFCIASAMYGRSMAFEYDSPAGRACRGEVLCPDSVAGNVVAIFVQHRLQSEEQLRLWYGGLVDNLLRQGVSCCFYENRLDNPQAAGGALSWFDMADDAIAVYEALRGMTSFKDAKIGFVGASEAGCSALVAAASVSAPGFLVQLVSPVENPLLIEMQVITRDRMMRNYMRNAWGRFIDMPFNVYTSIFQDILQDIRDKKIGERDTYIERLYERHATAIKGEREVFVRQLNAFLTVYCDRQGNGQRLAWDAERYYRKLECPMLYVSALHDTHILCFPNVVRLEKIMHKHRKSNFNVVVVDATHNLNRYNRDRKHWEGERDDTEHPKKDEVFDAVMRWIAVNVG